MTPASKGLGRAALTLVWQDLHDHYTNQAEAANPRCSEMPNRKPSTLDANILQEPSIQALYEEILQKGKMNGADL